MSLIFSKRIGDWNTQLYRELKIKLTGFNIFIAVVSSFACQFIVYAYYSTLEDQPQELWWWHMFWQKLNWILPTLLIVGGVYMIMSDLVKEERRGTLNLIKLSPESSQSILLGKIVGVPILLYLAIALAIPMNCFYGLGIDVAFGTLVLLYIHWVATCCLFYSTAVLIALIGASHRGSQFLPLIGSVLALMLASPYTKFLNASKYLWSISANWHWFFLPIGSEPLLLYAWTLGTIGIANYWIWQGIKRRFRNPNATLLSKKQSYWLGAILQIWLLGFVVPDNEQFGFSILAFSVNSIIFLILIAVLSPGRQTLKDWARYKNITSRQEWIWGEKSPAVVAIAINLAIALLPKIPWILLSGAELDDKTRAILNLLCFASLIIIYAAIAQLILLTKAKNPMFWAAGAVGVAIALPPIVATVLSASSEQQPILWLFTIFPAIATSYAPTTTKIVALLSQWSILVLLSFKLNRQLRLAGESTTKALLNGRQSLPREA
jgi:hypothetical protein